jgi:hypothetical protein
MRKMKAHGLLERIGTGCRCRFTGTPHEILRDEFLESALPKPKRSASKPCIQYDGATG